MMQLGHQKRQCDIHRGAAGAGVKEKKLHHDEIIAVANTGVGARRMSERKVRDRGRGDRDKNTDGLALDDRTTRCMYTGT